jgi:hypothetical protein
MRGSRRGATGFFGFVLLTLMTGVVITAVTGDYWIWPSILLGLVVALIAVRSIH